MQGPGTSCPRYSKLSHWFSVIADFSGEGYVEHSCASGLCTRLQRKGAGSVLLGDSAFPLLRQSPVSCQPSAPEDLRCRIWCLTM